MWLDVVGLIGWGRSTEAQGEVPCGEEGAHPQLRIGFRGGEKGGRGGRPWIGVGRGGGGLMGKMGVGEGAAEVTASEGKEGCVRE